MDGSLFLLGLILFVGVLLWRGPRQERQIVVAVVPSEMESTHGSGCVLAAALLLAILFVGVLAG